MKSTFCSKVQSTLQPNWLHGGDVNSLRTETKDWSMKYEGPDRSGIHKTVDQVRDQTHTKFALLTKIFERIVL